MEAFYAVAGAKVRITLKLKWYIVNLDFTFHNKEKQKLREITCSENATAAAENAILQRLSQWQDQFSCKSRRPFTITSNHVEIEHKQLKRNKNLRQFTVIAPTTGLSDSMTLSFFF